MNSADRQPDSHLVDRVSEHLDHTARQITLDRGDAVSIRHRADRRAARRRRLRTVGAIAAGGVGVVGGIAYLSRPPEAIITTPLVSGPTSTTPSSYSPSTAPATAPATIPPTSAVREDTGLTPADVQIKATEADPLFVWRVVDPGESASISGFSMSEGGGSFPGFAISTAPGVTELVGEPEAVWWHTDDGIVWEPTTIESPFGRPAWSASSFDDRIFAVGTAPGVARSEPNPLQLAIHDGESWTMIELPLDDNATRSLPMGETFRNNSIVRDGDNILVASNIEILIDWGQVAAAAGLREFEVTDEGVITLDDCAAPPSTSFVNELDYLLDPLTTIEPWWDSCDRTLHTWESLGIPEETAAALKNRSTRFFLITPDRNVTEIDGPEPGGVYYPAGGDLFARSIQTEGESAVAARYNDGAWQYIFSPEGKSMGGIRPFIADSMLVDIGISSSRLRSFDGTAVTDIDLGSMLDPDTSHYLTQSTQVGDTWVGIMNSDPVPTAPDGEPKITQNDVSIALTPATGALRFISEPTGETIPRERLVDNGDQTVDVLDPSGGVIATFDLGIGLDTLYNQIDYSGGADPAVLSTTDGESFAIEPLTDLLDVDTSEIRNVSRLVTDGSTVVITVTLTEEYADGTPKQLTLVGTPIG